MQNKVNNYLDFMFCLSYHKASEDLEYGTQVNIFLLFGA